MNFRDAGRVNLRSMVHYKPVKADLIGQSGEARLFKTSLGNIVRLRSRGWWHAPVIPATGEAEAGE